MAITSNLKRLECTTFLFTVSHVLWYLVLRIVVIYHGLFLDLSVEIANENTHRLCCCMIFHSLWKITRSIPPFTMKFFRGRLEHLHTSSITDFFRFACRSRSRRMIYWASRNAVGSDNTFRNLPNHSQCKDPLVSSKRCIPYPPMKQL